MRPTSTEVHWFAMGVVTACDCSIPVVVKVQVESFIFKYISITMEGSVKHVMCVPCVCVTVVFTLVGASYRCNVECSKWGVCKVSM
ncbi:uncharacterized protein BJ212DRAFT_1392535 [Suillus subaureus]|uniref:Uncharacterized protein n=1 Tax=Suillus subaureus TaxID=48587 RepID=A0A9P7DWW3_9AGAM|nr:uncharacterized protein BJ212DRAFT_1392535 [Suillus subaureus]KAG1805177.1 hypothetical protein BJ212DRAFT_1392535 [Suillus subaureus]